MQPSHSNSTFPLLALVAGLLSFVPLLLVLSFDGVPHTTPQPRLAPQLIVSEIGQPYVGDDAVDVAVGQPGQSIGSPDGYISVNVHVCQTGSLSADRDSLRQVIKDNLDAGDTLEATSVGGHSWDGYFGFYVEGSSDQEYAHRLAQAIHDAAGTYGYCNVDKRLVNSGSGFPY